MNPTISAVIQGWYLPDPTTLSPIALEVFQKYTDLPTDSILPHILAMRECAWKVYPYPCIGAFRFLDFSISESPNYAALITRLQHGATLLDLGCCFGQDLRKLISDGAPPANLYGADIRPDFIDLGYDLFRDRSTLQSTFLAPANIFDDAEDALLVTLNARMDVVHIGSFLHLFEYADQVRAVRRIAGLLKQVKGSVVLGRQIGSLKSGEYRHPTNKKQTMFRHDCETFKKLWGEAGGEWEVDAELQMTKRETDQREPVFGDVNARWLRFVVTRK